MTGVIGSMGVGLCAALALGATATGSAVAAEMPGTWTVSGDFGRSVRYTLVCVFDGDDRSFSGPCAGRTGEALPTTGRVNGDRIQFSYHTDYNGSGLTLMFAGTQGVDKTITGTATANTSKGVFQAQPIYNEGDTTTYKVSVAFSDDIRYVDLCTFKASGGRLSGPCAVTDGSSLPVTGSVEGSTVSFAYDTQFAGKPVHLDYKGVLAAGAIRGTIKSNDGEGTFAAQKP